MGKNSPDGEFIIPLIAGFSRAYNKSKYEGENSIWEIGINYAIGYGVSNFNNATSYYGLKNHLPGIQITPQIIEGSENFGGSVNGFIGTNYLGYDYSGAYIHENNIYGNTGFESTSTFQIGPFYTTKYKSGKYTQRTDGFKGRIPGFAFVELRYENDGTPFQHFPGFTDGKDENGVVHDRWRTASLSAKFGFGITSFTMGVDLFTGKPDRTNTKDIGLKQRVYDNESADKYRHGAIWLGMGNQRIGINSEWIRDAVQNQFSHNLLKPQPFFRPLYEQFPNRFYYANYRRSRYHYW